MVRKFGLSDTVALATFMLWGEQKALSAQTRSEWRCLWAAYRSLTQKGAEKNPRTVETGRFSRPREMLYSFFFLLFFLLLR